MKRLKCPPALAQFFDPLDKDTFKKIFKLLQKYSPESKKEKKERLQKEAKEKMKDDKKKEGKKPIYLKSGLNHVTYLIEQKRAKLVLIAADVDPIETVVFLPSLCKTMEIPYAIVSSKERLGFLVGKKTTTCVAQLLEELKRVKANDAREITRLKKELAAVREVLRSYIRQVDSLNQINASLRSENSQIRSELAQTNREKEGLQNEKQTLTEKVAIAAQLDATGITLTAMKGDKPTRKNKLKKANKLKVTYTISKNVTASNGQRTIYTSIRKPNGDVLAGGGSFSYENKQLKASAKNTIEYTGEQITVTAYWTGSEVLSGGDYLVSIFADGHLIGSGRFNMVE